jgi:hypothetical protein
LSLKVKRSPDFPRDQIEGAEAQGELLEETAQNKKERLGRLDFLLEFDFFDENFCWPNESEETGGPAIGLFPECDRGRTEPRSEFIGASAASWPRVWMPHLWRMVRMREISAACCEAGLEGCGTPPN